MVAMHVEVQPIWKGDADKKPRAKGSKFKMQNEKRANDQTKKKTRIEIGLLHGFHCLCIHFVCRLLSIRFHWCTNCTLEHSDFRFCALQPTRRKKRHAIHTETRMSGRVCARASLLHFSYRCNDNCMRANSQNCTFRGIAKEKRALRDVMIENARLTIGAMGCECSQFTLTQIAFFLHQIPCQSTWNTTLFQSAPDALHRLMEINSFAHSFVRVWCSTDKRTNGLMHSYLQQRCSVHKSTFTDTENQPKIEIHSRSNEPNETKRNQ